MTDDLISRQAAIDAIVNTVSEIGLHDNSEVARYGATFRQHEIIDIIECVPSAEPERKKGKWVLIHKGEKGYSYGDFKCSVCDRVNTCYHLTEYCCHCGAEMERTRVKKK